MKDLYDQVSMKCSKLVTRSYSTSFSLGIRFLDKKYHYPIYAIYGFVRAADEIVDSFHDYPKAELLQKFKDDAYQAIAQKISSNPILNSFQNVVHQYHIERELIDTFFNSMEMDLQRQEYDLRKYQEYIKGSAEVVGLMCLRVFCEGDHQQYEALRDPAMKLGSAFQKINFLRDIKNDYQSLGRSYFPEVDLEHFDKAGKEAIQKDIAADFDAGYQGIKKLPKGARLGVYVAYVYYKSLLRKIGKTPPEIILNKRIRIPNPQKYLLFIRSYFQHQLNLI